MPAHAPIGVRKGRSQLCHYHPVHCVQHSVQDQPSAQ
jgi:hypothetical protein